MMHYWECRRCTNQWTSSCCTFYGDNSPEAQLKRRKKLWSWLCSACFEKLENGDFGVVQEVYALSFKLRDRSDSWENERLKTLSKDHEYDYKKLRADQEAKGMWVAELYRVVTDIEETYKSMISEFKTPARLALDEYQKTQNYYFFGPQPRPEGFVGD